MTTKDMMATALAVTIAGDCRLLTWEPGDCGGDCASLCIDGECVAYPEARSAETVDIGGLAVEITVEPTEFGTYYVTQELPADLFGDGASITASAEGDELDGFEVEVAGATELEAAIDDQVMELAAGVDHRVTWTPAGGGAVRLTLNSANQGHAQPLDAIIECDADDAAGELTVPAALIDQFPAMEFAPFCAGHDCPPSSLSRRSRATAPSGDARVALEVSSEVHFFLEHTP